MPRRGRKREEHQARVTVTLLGNRSLVVSEGRAPYPAPHPPAKPCSCEICEGARLNQTPRQHHEAQRHGNHGGNNDPDPEARKKRTYEDIKQAALCPQRIRSFFVAPAQEELTPFQIEHCNCEHECCKAMFNKSQDAEHLLREVWRASKQGEQHELFLQRLRSCYGPSETCHCEIQSRWLFAICGQRVCERYFYDFF